MATGITPPIPDQAKAWAEHHAGRALHLYAMTDPALDRASTARLSRCGVMQLSLLGGMSAPTEGSPQLLLLGWAEHLSEAVGRALERGLEPAAYTLICSPLEPPVLQAHLARFVDVRLPGDQDMLLALWDPAILGTLVGQADDDTLHVPGPVLHAEQRRALLAPIAFWWYGDRETHWHRIEGEGDGLAEQGGAPAEQSLALDQSQEDALVEASVPDQILFHLRQNRPSLLDNPDLPNANYYRFVCQVLKGARLLGLEGMRDLVNFVALCLIYRQRVETDPQILRLLDQVQRKALSMDEAMKLMPE